MNSTLKSSNNRIILLDALRGFAIILIFIVHVQEHFNLYNFFPSVNSQPEWLNNLDNGILKIIFSLLSGKSYSIFALLFGVTFYIQYHNQEKKGKDFGYRFLWRMFILFIFGIINSMFFPGGDVLFIYAITAISLFIVRKWSNRAILITAIILLAQPIEWTHYIISLYNPNYTLPNWRTTELYTEVIRVSTEGNWKEYFYTNMTTGALAHLSWTISVGRLLQTAGLFLLGYLMGRTKLFLITERNIRIWTYILIVAAILYNPLLELKNIIELRGSTDTITQGTLTIVFDMWQKLAFTFILISSFILLYQTNFFIRLTNNLQYLGRMTLTNYIVQSIVGTFIFLPGGLNLGIVCGNTVSLLISVILIYLQTHFCKWWLSRHRQGPLEMVWHQLTWLNSKS